MSYNTITLPVLPITLPLAIQCCHLALATLGAQLAPFHLIHPTEQQSGNEQRSSSNVLVPLLTLLHLIGLVEEPFYIL